MAMSRSQAASVASRSRSHESRVNAGKLAAKTREEKNPGSLSAAGRKGGQNSHRGSKRTGQED